MAIERVKYFSGDTELEEVMWMRKDEFQRRFPGVVGKRVDSSSLYAGITKLGSKEIFPVTRIVEYKKNPSLHKCDARCQNAKGKVCECSCGGKHHGINA